MDNIDEIRSVYDRGCELREAKKKLSHELNANEIELRRLLIEHFEPLYRERDRWAENYEDTARLWINAGSLAIDVPCVAQKPQRGYCREIYRLNLVDSD